MILCAQPGKARKDRELYKGCAAQTDEKEQNKLSHIFDSPR